MARLSGGRAHVSDHTNASRTLLYNLHTRGWDPDLLQLFGVPVEVLPAIVPSAGIIAETDSELLGYAVPIAGLAGDQQAALFGQGCCRVGLAKNTYGTGAFLLVYRGDQLPRPAKAFWPRPPVVPEANRRTRWRVAYSSRAPRCSGSGTASGSSARRARPRR